MCFDVHIRGLGSHSPTDSLVTQVDDRELHVLSVHVAPSVPNLLSLPVSACARMCCQLPPVVL